MKYLILIEPTSTGFSAYSPDLPGCVATGATRQDVVHNMKEAVRFHIQGLIAEGERLPTPDTQPEFVDID